MRPQKHAAPPGAACFCVFKEVMHRPTADILSRCSNEDMQPQKALEQLGYTKGEAKAYLAALSLGESHVSDIAHKIREPLSTTQTIVDKLHRNGLVNFYVRKRYKYWVAEKPEQLLARLKEHEESLRAVLPALETLRRGEEGKPRVKIFEGVEEIRLIYDDLLETRKPIAGIIPWEDWIGLLGRRFMEDFIEKRVRRGLHMRTLIPRSKIAEELRGRDSGELRETRYLPEEFPFKTTLLLYGPKVAIVSLNRKQPTATVIEDRDVHETMRLFFEQLWERCLDGRAMTLNLL